MASSAQARTYRGTLGRRPAPGKGSHLVSWPKRRSPTGVDVPFKTEACCFPSPGQRITCGVRARPAPRATGQAGTDTRNRPTGLPPDQSVPITFPQRARWPQGPRSREKDCLGLPIRARQAGVGWVCFLRESTGSWMLFLSPVLSPRSQDTQAMT